MHLGLLESLLSETRHHLIQLLAIKAYRLFGVAQLLQQHRQLALVLLNFLPELKVLLFIPYVTSLEHITLVRVFLCQHLQLNRLALLSLQPLRQLRELISHTAQLALQLEHSRLSMHHSLLAVLLIRSLHLQVALQLFLYPKQLFILLQDLFVLYLSRLLQFAVLNLQRSQCFPQARTLIRQLLKLPVYSPYLLLQLLLLAQQTHPSPLSLLQLSKQHLVAALKLPADLLLRLNQLLLLQELIPQLQQRISVFLLNGDEVGLLKPVVVHQHEVVIFQLLNQGSKFHYLIAKSRAIDNPNIFCLLELARPHFIVLPSFTQLLLQLVPFVLLLSNQSLKLFLQIIDHVLQVKQLRLDAATFFSLLLDRQLQTAYHLSLLINQSVVLGKYKFHCLLELFSISFYLGLVLGELPLEQGARVEGFDLPDFGLLKLDQQLLGKELSFLVLVDDGSHLLILKYEGLDAPVAVVGLVFCHGNQQLIIIFISLAEDIAR